MTRLTAILCLLLAGFISTGKTSDTLISRKAAIEDIRSLTRTIESVHPDPYINCGGKIAFHRRIMNVMESIPDSGVSGNDLYSIFAPIAAAVKDGHTSVSTSHVGDPYSPGGIPLYFSTACEGLVVGAVLKEEHRALIGALLVSVEGVSVDSLAERLTYYKGSDNIYQLYRSLGTQGALWYEHSLRRLLPEWQRSEGIEVELRTVNGDLVQEVLTIPEKIDYASFIMAPTAEPELVNQYLVQAQRCDLFYFFLDSTRQTCVLAIRGLSTYREAFEAWQSLGVTNRENQARNLYQRYHSAQPPEKLTEVIAGLPSATELLREMVKEMKVAQTKNLFVDVSQNDGGSSLMSNILIYFLYGKDKLLALKGRTTEIVKYSPEYFNIYPSPSLNEMNSSRTLPLLGDEYDFAADHAHHEYPGLDLIEQELEEVVDWMPTFAADYHSGAFDKYYRPDNVKVLCDAGTYSAAFWVMYYLKQAGAEIAGIPSAQAGNCFGDILKFTLPNSGLKYTVSRKYFEMFPDDPAKGHVLMPDYPMTYQVMADYNFDPFCLINFAADLTENK